MNLVLDQYRSSLHQLAETLKKFDYNIPPVMDQKNLETMSEERAEELLGEVELQLKLYNSLEEIEFGSRKFEAEMIKNFLDWHGYTANSEFYDIIDEGDIIEVYDMNFKQRFRNLRFYDLCSYGLDELHNIPFFELFSRANNFTEDLVNELKTKHQVSDVNKFKVKPHLLKETYADKRNVYTYESKYITGVFKKGPLGRDVPIAALISAKVKKHTLGNLNDVIGNA